MHILLLDLEVQVVSTDKEIERQASIDMEFESTLSSVKVSLLLN